MANNGQKKGGLFARLTRLPERSEDYARSTLPTNRWALGWDIFKTNLGKIVKINLLMLLFLFPIFLVMGFNWLYIQAQSLAGPFSQNIAFSYPAYPYLNGVSETILFQADLISFIFLFISSFYIAIGLAGGFYVMRNMVWTEGIFVAADFWSGVKKNYKVALKSSLMYVFFLGISVLSIDLANVQLSLNSEHTALLTISKVISIVAIVFFTIMFLYQLTLGVTYEIKFFHLIKNSAILSIALIPVNAFFAAFSLITFLPLLFSNVSIIFTVGIILILFFGLAVFALIWTNYNQWVFDQFINDKVPGAKKDKGIYRQNKIEEENYDFTPSKLTQRPIKPITDYDVEIAALPESYSRADLLKLQESKKAMIEDSDRYAEEHKNDYKEAESKIDDFMKDEGKK